jgi:peptidyl-prolyl cis-trans isomerase SurA
VRVDRGLRLALACSLLALPAAGEELADGIAAQVGNEIVLVSEVMRLVAPLEAEIRAKGATESDVARLRADGLERLIEWRLIEQVVKKSELYATDEEIDATIASIAKSNKLSIDALKDSVTSHGLSYEDYRNEIKQEIERRKAVNMMVGSHIQVDESEVRALYDKQFGEQPEGGTALHLRQILVTYGEENGRTRDQACVAARAARDRIAAGEAFGVVASEVSDVAAERGGDIGYLHLDKAAPWMKKVVAGLEPGQCSDVIELPFACGLVQLVERQEYKPVTYEQAHERLQQQVYDQKMEEAMNKWLDELRAHTYIERKGYFADASSFQKSSGESPGSSLP